MARRGLSWKWGGVIWLELVWLKLLVIVSSNGDWIFVGDQFDDVQINLLCLIHLRWNILNLSWSRLFELILATRVIVIMRWSDPSFHSNFWYSVIRRLLHRATSRIVTLGYNWCDELTKTVTVCIDCSHVPSTRLVKYDERKGSDKTHWNAFLKGT